MVCIAAFIILAVIGIFVAILSIFKPKIWKSYIKALKKAWGCFSKKVRLQKCETGFKDDIKNTLLSRVAIKYPKWLKPLSIMIELASLIIIVIVVWAFLTAVKSLLALWALNTCNVTKPTACTLGAEVCSIDDNEPTNPLEAAGRWFTEWGEIFEAIPDKFHEYKAEDYNFSYITINSDNHDKPIVIDIFDPGCLVCATSYKNQKEAGFFDEYEVRLVPFVIMTPDGNSKFANSEIVARYILAIEQIKAGAAAQIIDKIFTEKDSEGIPYQNKFNEDYSQPEAASKIEQWLKESGLNDEEISEIRRLVDSEEITGKIQENSRLVTDELRVKGIPTMIYDGKKHTGLFKM